MKALVERQAEKIIDEGAGTYRDVIVRMGSGISEDRTDFVTHASRALRSRPLVLSARDIIPEAPSVLRSSVGSKRSRSQRLKLRKQLASSSAQVSLSTSRVGRRDVVSRAERDFGELAKHEPVQKALGRRKSGSDTKPFFWASSSAFLRLGKDELDRLSKDGTGILDIYPNRPLQIPSVVEVRNLPANVVDNRASAWGVAGIGALAAWGAYSARGNGVKVGVLDTGVDDTHPDLLGKVTAFAEFDAAGLQVPGAPTRDSDQHGTHVCGTIAGGNDSGEWIGVAPDCELAVGLVLDGAVGGTDAQVLAGIDWALDQNVDVINMSLGGLTLGPDVPNTYHQAVVTCLLAGVPVVTAIGNEGSQTSGLPGNDLFAFSVGATDVTDRAAGFSGGRTHVIRSSAFLDPGLLPLPYSKPDIAAPGVAVRSAIPNGGYAVFNGTSMATPHVAGAVAQLLSATSNLASVSDNQRAFVIQDFLLGSVEELGEAGQDHRFGFGRLDVLRAIGFAREAGF